MKNPIETRFTQLACGLVALALITLTQPVHGQGAPPFTGHYPAGVEGIKAGSLPPPGLYFRDYNLFYFADKYPGGPDDFKVFAYVNAPRLIWITDFTILGGNYGMDALLPLGYTNLEIGPFRDRHFSVGDVHIEPITLSWRKEKFDAAVGYAFWAPTGGFDAKHPARLGKGFWSHMFTGGGTWHLDPERTWALSALNRYEIHHKHRDFNITPGDNYTLEWGVSKSIRPTIDAGVVGYYQQQVTRDRGPGASSEKDRVAAIGPEIAAVIPKVGLISSLRYLREFAAKDRPEGNTVTLTLTKRF
jgi:hypothetical protein